jgi:hypothetical protein
MHRELAAPVEEGLLIVCCHIEVGARCEHGVHEPCQLAVRLAEVTPVAGQDQTQNVLGWAMSQTGLPAGGAPQWGCKASAIGEAHHGRIITGQLAPTKSCQ